MGGIAAHVKCLTESLPPDVERYVIGIGGDEEFAGRNGHDIREWFQIRRVIKTFKPDVVHFHIPNLVMALYLRVRTLKPSNPQTLKLSNPQTLEPSNPQTFSLVCSWHTPTNRKLGLGQRLFFWLLGKDCYYLPVSTPTWEGLKRCLPWAKGEVFFNSIRIEGSKVREFESSKVKPSNLRTFELSNFIVGMVGRNADVKDWPSFHRVEEIVRGKVREFEGLRVRGFEGLKVEELKSAEIAGGVEFLNAGEKEVCNGREAIAKMDLFMMTSKHEQLPTTLLECFALGTPVCGFLPDGGTSDILGFSNGPVREAFIRERSCEKLADVVLDLMAHPEKRQALVDDGRQILLNHFDAEKNCRERLMRVYEGLRV